MMFHSRLRSTEEWAGSSFHFPCIEVMKLCDELEGYFFEADPMKINRVRSDGAAGEVQKRKKKQNNKDDADAHKFIMMSLGVLAVVG